MILRVDDASPVPPYEQIREQIETMVLSGVLPVGHRLPSIRQLATDLQLAPATVARAYSALESAGVVTSRRGRGTSVAAQRPKQVKREDANSELTKAAQAFARRAHQLGVAPAVALRTISRALDVVDRSAAKTARL